MKLDAILLAAFLAGASLVSAALEADGRLISPDLDVRQFRGGGGRFRGGGRQGGGRGGFGGGRGRVTSTSVADAGATATASVPPDAAATDVAIGDGQTGGDGTNVGGDGQDGQANAGNSADPQQSLTLLADLVQPGLAQDGGAAAGQVPSLTSTNNFINFCDTVQLPLTDGQQIVGGSCNPTPMGVIVAQARMPSCKFTFPANGATIAADETFTLTMAIRNLATGNFVNPQTNYFGAPAQTDGQGTLIGHSHAVIEQIASLDATTPNDPRDFAFFKGLNDAAQNGELSAEVTGGLAAGTYKMCSINSAANHQPALVAVAQHASLDDCVYFTATAGGAAAAAGEAAAAAAGGGAGGQQQQGGQRSRLHRRRRLPVKRANRHV